MGVHKHQDLTVIERGIHTDGHDLGSKQLPERQCQHPLEPRRMHPQRIGRHDQTRLGPVLWRDAPAMRPIFIIIGLHPIRKGDRRGHGWHQLFKDAGEFIHPTASERLTPNKTALGHFFIASRISKHWIA